MILFAGVKGFIDRVDVNKVTAYEKAWLSHIKASHKVWSGLRLAFKPLNGTTYARILLCSDLAD